MTALKHILFLTLFLLFITIIATADYSNAADRVRSQFPEKITGATQSYMHGSHQPITSAWSNQDWIPERYGISDLNKRKKIMNRLESSGLIKEIGMDKNGLPLIRVGDLFLRLADSDKYKILQTVDYILNPEENNRNYLAYAVQHERSEQFLGIYSKEGLQLQ